MRKKRNSRANIEYGARRSARHSTHTARIKHLSLNISFTKIVPPRPRFLLLSRYLLPWFRRRSFLSLRVTQCGVLLLFGEQKNTKNTTLKTHFIFNKSFSSVLFSRARTRYYTHTHKMILDFTKSGDKPTAKAITLACVF